MADIPAINIGLVGHVDHGKTTLTEQLSGRWTDTHSEELKRGITIRLGYADTVICEKKGAKDFPKFTTKKDKNNTPVRHMSLIDAPGHESLMATMLAGASLMDGALLMVAANETCPQPQTIEHLMALEIAGIKNVIVVQNKIDLVSEERALRNYDEIQAFLAQTSFKDAPIIPISAVQGVNIDALVSVIQDVIPTPVRKTSDDPTFFVARSFDVNKPGTKPGKLQGGVLGGAVITGAFAADQDIEIRPGRVVQEANQQVAKPITTKIVSVMAGGSSKSTLTPGGSSAMMTLLDPSIVKSDALSGSYVGVPGKLPPIWHEITIDVYLLDRVVGEDTSVQPVKLKEMLLLNVHSATTVGAVVDLGKDKCSLALRLPVCAAKGDRVALSRRVGSRFRLVGYGVITGGRQQE